MAQIDLHHKITVSMSINVAATTATANGTGVDVSNYEGVEFAFIAGTRTDGTHTPKLQDSPDNSVWSDVDTSLVLTQSGGLVAMTTNTVQRCGYMGVQRYVRPVITVSGATTGAVEGCIAILSNAKKQPLA